jgi:SPP1 family predicted phage head-tail adaptor
MILGQPRLGDLRHRVALQILGGSTTPGTRGESQQTWREAGTVRAKIDTLNGDERYFANRYQADATHTVTVRYHPSVSVRARFVFRGRTLHVKHVDNLDQRNVWQVCTCEEAVE